MDKTEAARIAALVGGGVEYKRASTIYEIVMAIDGGSRGVIYHSRARAQAEADRLNARGSRHGTASVRARRVPAGYSVVTRINW